MFDSSFKQSIVLFLCTLWYQKLHNFPLNAASPFPGMLFSKLVLTLIISSTYLLMETLFTHLWIFVTISFTCPTLGYCSLLGESKRYNGLENSQDAFINFPSPFYRHAGTNGPDDPGLDVHSFKECETSSWLR